MVILRHFFIFLFPQLYVKDLYWSYLGFGCFLGRGLAETEENLCLMLCWVNGFITLTWTAASLGLGGLTLTSNALAHTTFVCSEVITHGVRLEEILISPYYLNISIYQNLDFVMSRQVCKINK